MAEDKRDFSTLYEEEQVKTDLYDTDDAGMLAFDKRDDLEGEIGEYLEMLNTLKKDYSNDELVTEGLREVELQLQALRVSNDPREMVTKKLAALTRIPVSDGKVLRLDAFRKTTSSKPLSGHDDYVTHVKKLVRNTEMNINQLLISFPEDTILKKLFANLKEINLDSDPKALKAEMTALAKSPQLWHYTDKKKDYLVEWLRPYQAHFGQPLEKLSAADIQKAITLVENLRNKDLKELANLELLEERGPYRIHNRRMHPVMNGKNKDFWGSDEVRDEFITLIHKLLRRFSLNLEDRFILFNNTFGEFVYLVGFSDDAFDEVAELAGGQLGLYPHLKVFTQGENSQLNELSQDAFPGDGPGYYKALKTSAVPFLTAMAQILEIQLTEELRTAFDMWI